MLIRFIIALADLALPVSLYPQNKPLHNDAPRAVTESRAAYKRLRSYSGRFQMTDTEVGVVQSGEVRWARPNYLALRISTRGQSGSYTRRAVCDGRFFYASDSRAPNRFVKSPVGREPEAIEAMFSFCNDQSTMFLGGLLAGQDWLQGVADIRVTSAPGAPTLSLEARFNIDTVPEDKDSDVLMTTTLSKPVKMQFRFGPDKLLRQVSTQYIEPSPSRASEKHMDIRFNPGLPASTFLFKPTPGARQVKRLDVPQ